MNKIKKFCAAVLLAAIFQSFALAQAQRANIVVLYDDKQTPATLYTGSYALVIGVSDYTNGWKSLSGVKEDVPAVKAALEKQNFVVETLMNPKDRNALEGRISEFIDKYGFGLDNRLLIYFAGHGYAGKTIDGRDGGYIVPANAPLPGKDADGFDRAAVRMDTILYFAEQIRAKHALFVFDSCFSGELFSTRDSGEIAVPDFIEEQVAQKVRQFITAGAANQTVPDKSIFREFFVRGLAGEADRDGDGYILGSELANYLQKNVTDYSKRYETPQYGKIRNSNLDRGDFVFVAPKKPTLAGVKPVQAPAPTERDFKSKTRAEIERDAWLLVQDSTDAQDFRDFLESFKGGAYEARAKARLEQTIWDAAKNSNDKAKIQAYLTEFPSGENAFAAKSLIRKIEAASAPMKTANAPTTGAANNSALKAGAISKVQLPNGAEMEFAYIPAGEFMKDSTQEKWKKITQDFQIQTTELTQGQWKNIMGALPSKCDYGNLSGKFLGNDKLVICVSWEDAQELIRRMNARNDGYSYRLPAEAEWVYAAHAGKGEEYHKNSVSIENLDAVAWYAGNSDGHPHNVATKKANAWGLYDMFGNINEWLQDLVVYTEEPESSNSERVSRCGDYSAQTIGSSRRSSAPQSLRTDIIGFRLVRR